MPGLPLAGDWTRWSAGRPGGTLAPPVAGGGGGTLSDKHIIYTAAAVRGVATGLMGVLLGLYLAQLQYTPVQLGVVVGAGLIGAALSTLVVTLAGDRLGRRRSLIVLALLSAAGGAALVLTGHPALIALVAFIGMVNGMGRDRAAALVLEQATLPQTTDDRRRTQAFAWYNVLQDAGHASGALLAGVPAVLQRFAGLEVLLSYELVLGLYAALHAATAALYVLLSPAVEAQTGGAGRRPRLSAQTRSRLARIAALFAVDSLAGGFLTGALLSYFFFERFGASGGIIATLFFLARVANGISHLGAAWLAARIGLINTMVFTHIPSSLMLVAVALVPEFWMAAALFVARELLVEMDVPTRQSYVMAVVQPQERTFASGVTGLVRMSGWAVAPFVAGFLMQGVALAAPLLIGAGMKIGYDLMLYASFRSLKPPEELA